MPLGCSTDHRLHFLFPSILSCFFFHLFNDDYNNNDTHSTKTQPRQESRQFRHALGARIDHAGLDFAGIAELGRTAGGRHEDEKAARRGRSGGGGARTRRGWNGTRSRTGARSGAAVVERASYLCVCVCYVLLRRLELLPANKKVRPCGKVQEFGIALDFNHFFFFTKPTECLCVIN